MTTTDPVSLSSSVKHTYRSIEFYSTTCETKYSPFDPLQAPLFEKEFAISIRVHPIWGKGLWVIRLLPVDLLSLNPDMRAHLCALDSPKKMRELPNDGPALIGLRSASPDEQERRSDSLHLDHDGYLGTSILDEGPKSWFVHSLKKVLIQLSQSGLSNMMW